MTCARFSWPCAGLMIATGIAFPASAHFVFIALVAFIGTINPTTGDIGVHVPLEQAAVARSVPDRERTRTFARYSLIGALAIAVGCAHRRGSGCFGLAGDGQARCAQAHVLCLRCTGAALRPCSMAFLPHATSKQTSSPLRMPLGEFPAQRCTSLQPCSASISLPEGSRCNPCWRCGCSSASIFR